MAHFTLAPVPRTPASLLSLLSHSQFCSQALCPLLLTMVCPDLITAPQLEWQEVPGLELDSGPAAKNLKLCYCYCCFKTRLPVIIGIHLRSSGHNPTEMFACIQLNGAYARQPPKEYVPLLL